MKDFLNQWMPVDASSYGFKVDELIVWLHWLMLILFVGWGIFFAFTLIRFHRSRQPRADYNGVKNHVSSYLEIGVALFEAALLIGFSIPFWIQKVDAFPPKDEAIEVRVVAEQYAWNVHYPGEDGIFGRTDIKLIDTQSNPLGLDYSDERAKDDITTVNQLHLPVNKPAIVHLSSKDVIHGFSLPVMRVKQDAIPGMSIPIWFKPTKLPAEGEKWEIACAQLCGLGHYRMRGDLIIHSQHEFDRWFAKKSEEAKSSGEEEEW